MFEMADLIGHGAYARQRDCPVHPRAAGSGAGRLWPILTAAELPEQHPGALHPRVEPETYRGYLRHARFRGLPGNAGSIKARPELHPLRKRPQKGGRPGLRGAGAEFLPGKAYGHDAEEAKEISAAAQKAGVEAMVNWPVIWRGYVNQLIHALNAVAASPSSWNISTATPARWARGPSTGAFPIPPRK